MTVIDCRIDYFPLCFQDLDENWRRLLKAETAYTRQLDEHYRQ